MRIVYGYNNYIDLYICDPMAHLCQYSLTVSSRTRVLVDYYKSSGVVPAFVPAPCRRRCPIPFFIDTSQLILLCICARSVPPPVPDPTADSGRRRQTAADGSRQRQTAADGGRWRQTADPIFIDTSQLILTFCCHKRCAII